MESGINLRSAVAEKTSGPVTAAVRTVVKDPSMTYKMIEQTIVPVKERGRYREIRYANKPRSTGVGNR